MDFIFYAPGRTWHIVRGTIDYVTHEAEVRRKPQKSGEGDLVQHFPAYPQARANVLCGTFKGALRPDGFDIETGGLETISFTKFYEAWRSDRTRDLALGYKISPMQVMVDSPFPPAPLCRHCAKIAGLN